MRTWPTTPPLLGLCALITLAACGKAPGHIDAVAAASPTPPGAAAQPVADPGQATPDAASFAREAAAGDLYEMRAAEIALKRAANADLKAFARTMIQDHGRASATLRQALAQVGRSDLAPAPALPADKQAKLDALGQTSGRAFDALYADQQIGAHQEAVQRLQDYAENGDAPALKAAAGTLAPTVQAHLDRINAIASGLP